VLELVCGIGYIYRAPIKEMGERIHTCLFSVVANAAVADNLSHAHTQLMLGEGVVAPRVRSVVLSFCANPL
jgi:hypothetical protein